MFLDRSDLVGEEFRCARSDGMLLKDQESHVHRFIRMHLLDFERDQLPLTCTG